MKPLGMFPLPPNPADSLMKQFQDRVSEDVARRLDSVLRLLEPFSLQRIQGRDGQVYEVLASPVEKNDISEFDAFQGIPSPPTSIPAPDGQALKFRVHVGNVNGQLAENWQEEFTAPANSATPFFCWLEIDLTAEASENLVAGFRYDTGPDLPEPEAPGDDGEPPGTIYVPLFYVTTTATAIDAFEQIERFNLWVNLAVREQTCDSSIRDVQISRVVDFTSLL